MAALLAPRLALAAAARAPVRAVRPARRAATAVAAVSRTIISTDKAPGAVGPYSQAVVTNGLAFISGQVALVPGTKDLKAGGVAEQARQCLTNLSAILAAAGSSPAHVVKTTVLLADMADFGAVNAVYAEFFPADPPARACFAVKELPLGALVEIEAVAVVP